MIEGNRRLAAVRLLLNKRLREELRATDLPTVSASRARELEELPIVETTREAVWQYLGFKHVNGPARWESYPKAQYIATVHNQYAVSLAEIARQIGDKHGTVQRLYRALMVIEQAEKERVFRRENRFKGHFSFSHLYTGLDYDGCADFLDLQDETRESRVPVPKKRRKHLGELLLWVYGDRPSNRPPVIRSQNPDLRYLAAVLEQPKATDALRAGLPLQAALDVSLGDDHLFRTALVQAKDALQKARGTLSTGYDGETELLRSAKLIADLAYDLHEEMERKSTLRRRTRARTKKRR